MREISSCNDTQFLKTLHQKVPFFNKNQSSYYIYSSKLLRKACKASVTYSFLLGNSHAAHKIFSLSMASGISLISISAFYFSINSNRGWTVRILSLQNWTDSKYFVASIIGDRNISFTPSQVKSFPLLWKSGDTLSNILKLQASKLVRKKFTFT